MNSDLETAMAYTVQAIGRVKRLGQRRDEVHIWRFVAEGTVEAEISAEHELELRERDQRKHWLRANAERREKEEELEKEEERKKKEIAKKEAAEKKEAEKKKEREERLRETYGKNYERYFG
jgi:hypothetical protein